MPHDISDAILSHVSNFAVGLVIRELGKGSRVLGSGVLVSIEGRRGILTCGHVAEAYEHLPEVGLIRFVAGGQQRRVLKLADTQTIIVQSSETFSEGKEVLVSRFLDGETGARSLIIRVLVAARRAAGEGVPSEEIFEFLESSFGAFQARRAHTGWQWDRADLLAALADLEHHQLVQKNAAGAYELTKLGRLAGESAAEVGSIVALVECLSTLRPEEISDPVLIAAAQATVEVDEVLFPINKKSTQKEPQLWPNELRGQGVPGQVLNALYRGITEAHQSTLRAKKAVACLLFISGRAMNDIERIMTQFGGAFGGAAGPIRSVASRTCDLVPVAARVAEILHPTLDLGDRIRRLAIRLTYGVPGAVVELAQVIGGDLLRGDYCRLAAANLCEPEQIKAASSEQILACVDRDKRKLALVRGAGERIATQRAATSALSLPVLEPYVA